jgi:hypothetical protein
LSPRRVYAILALSFLAACGKETCRVENLVFTQTVTGTGSGALEGVPIARFEVTQNFLSHTPYSACPTGPLTDVGVADLTVTSLYPSPITLVYDLQGLTSSQVMAWSYRDSLPNFTPGQQITRTRISVSPVKLEQGARVVLVKIQPTP